MRAGEHLFRVRGREPVERFVQIHDQAVQAVAAVLGQAGQSGDFRKLDVVGQRRKAPTLGSPQGARPRGLPCAGSPALTARIMAATSSQIAAPRLPSPAPRCARRPNAGAVDQRFQCHWDRCRPPGIRRSDRSARHRGRVHARPRCSTLKRVLTRSFAAKPSAMRDGSSRSTCPSFSMISDFKRAPLALRDENKARADQTFIELDHSPNCHKRRVVGKLPAASIGGDHADDQRHAHQIRQAARLHLVHEIGAINLDGARADAEIEGDLLVGAAGHQPDQARRARGWRAPPAGFRSRRARPASWLRARAA